MAFDKNRSHGKIDSLPGPLKQKVELMLVEGYTYEQIAEFLRGEGCDIHLSSVYRFARSYIKGYEELQKARDFARLVAEDNPDRPSTELHEANNAMASQLLMDAIIDPDKPLDEKMEVVKLIARLQQAQTQTERAKIFARKENGPVKTAIAMLKERVFKEIQNEHPEIAALMIRIADDVEKEMQGV